MRVEIEGKTLELVQGDITKQETDAIVNAANSGLRGGGGVDGAIHRAGGPEIMAECRQIGGCPTGSACITTAGRLKARYVIHAVGPIWRGGRSGEPALLEGAYRKSLEIADEKKLSSISFPSISTGAYRYPLDQAAEIAIGTVVSYLKGETSVKKAVFVLFNQETLAAYQQALDKLLGKLTDKKPIAAGKSSFDLVDKEKVLAELNLRKGTVLLDVASGAGNYALEIANAMPEGGKIYAVDLWREGIDDLKRRAAERGLTNIRAVVADVSKEIPLRDNSVDVCFIATALHDLAEDNTAEGALKEMARVLKPGGNLVVIEFKKIEGPGPPLRIRLSPKELDALVLPFGFKSYHMVDVGAYTYLTVYTANKS